MSGSRGRRGRRSPIIEYARTISERTHPIVLPALMILALVPLGYLFLWAGPIAAPLILLGLAILIALVLEAIEQAQIRGWL
jgi:hypothetical protein